MEKTTCRCVPVLKTRLLQASILAFPNSRHPFVIDTDVTETAIRAVLLRKIYGEERPIAFEPRVLSKTRVNCATTKREALGVVQTMQWLRPYIYGSQCRVRTNQASLKWLCGQNPDGVTSVTSRMIQKVQKYNYRIVHGAEKSIVMPVDSIEDPMKSRNGKEVKKTSCEVKFPNFKPWKMHTVVLKKI